MPVPTIRAHDPYPLWVWMPTVGFRELKVSGLGPCESPAPTAWDPAGKGLLNPVARGGGKGQSSQPAFASMRDPHAHWGFPWGSAGKEFTCNARDLVSIPGLGRSPGEGKGYPLQYSGLENSMDCIVQGVAKSRT